MFTKLTTNLKGPRRTVDLGRRTAVLGPVQAGKSAIIDSIRFPFTQTAGGYKADGLVAEQTPDGILSVTLSGPTAEYVATTPASKGLNTKTIFSGSPPTLLQTDWYESAALREKIAQKFSELAKKEVQVPADLSEEQAKVWKAAREAVTASTQGEVLPLMVDIFEKAARAANTAANRASAEIDKTVPPTTQESFEALEEAAKAANVAVAAAQTALSEVQAVYGREVAAARTVEAKNALVRERNARRAQDATTRARRAELESKLVLTKAEVERLSAERAKAGENAARRAQLVQQMQKYTEDVARITAMLSVVEASSDGCAFCGSTNPVGGRVEELKRHRETIVKVYSPPLVAEVARIDEAAGSVDALWAYHANQAAYLTGQLSGLGVTGPVEEMEALQEVPSVPSDIEDRKNIAEQALAAAQAKLDAIEAQKRTALASRDGAMQLVGQRKLRDSSLELAALNEACRHAAQREIKRASGSNSLKLAEAALQQAAPKGLEMRITSEEKATYIEIRRTDVTDATWRAKAAMSGFERCAVRIACAIAFGPSEGPTILTLDDEDWAAMSAGQRRLIGALEAVAVDQIVVASSTLSPGDFGPAWTVIDLDKSRTAFAQILR